MVPDGRSGHRKHESAPRTRGDGPVHVPARPKVLDCSPHARGWSPPHDYHGHRHRLLPARAGMVPQGSARGSASPAAPRTRGDSPVRDFQRAQHWTCSPHARGWSHHRDRHTELPGLLPARAGMVPSLSSGSTRRAPAPRMRGDGPLGVIHDSTKFSCSPRTRGWSHHRPQPQEAAGLLPARGDGPCAGQKAEADRGCSPNPRSCLRPRPVCYGRSSAELEHRKEVPPIEGLPPMARA